MSAIPKHKMTMEEYIEFDKNSEGRWEYFDGEVVDCGCERTLKGWRAR